MKGLHHVELTYEPTQFNAVACSEELIFVADSAPGRGVHIHSWSGQHTQSLSHAQLGLQDYDLIWAIHYSEKCNYKHRSTDRALQLAIGDYGSETVHSLHACRVSDI